MCFRYEITEHNEIQNSYTESEQSELNYTEFSYFNLKMRTSSSQFETMVRFMELNGDLNKPTGSAMGRANTMQRWEELRVLLNSDPSGDPRVIEKWKKVWSDYKMNTKKKADRIHKSHKESNVGPALNISLSPIETRVLQIIGAQAAAGLSTVVEAGLPMIEVKAEPPVEQDFIDVKNISLWEPMEPSQEHDSSNGASNNVTGMGDPESSETLQNGLPARGRQSPIGQRLKMTHQIRAARGRRSLRRRANVSHTTESAASEFLRSDAAYREFERERWEREVQREADHNSLREREIEMRERDIELRERELRFREHQHDSMNKLCNRALDLLDNYLMGDNR